MTSPRILMVVTHLLGAGHLARMAAIARISAQQGARVTLASGGRVAPMVNVNRVEMIQLPPLHCEGADFRRLLDESGEPASPQLLEDRKAMLMATFDHAAPDVLVTELYPFGRRVLQAEFEALLAHARATRPRPVIVASIRDILNPPSRPERVEETSARLGAFYDAVLFHGDSAFAPCEIAWPVSPELRRRMTETGYVRDVADDPPRLEAQDPLPSGEIVVSVGSSAAGLPLWRAALEAARLMPRKTWRLLVGHGVNAHEFSALAGTAGANVIVERARSDFADLLRHADLSISQAGYNTILDLASAGARALLVPFREGNEKEQDLRAQAFARRGLVDVLTPDSLSGESLAKAATVVLARPRPDWSDLRMQGARASADLLIAFSNAARRRQAAWQRLDAALARAHRSKRELRFWLRDDDATAPSEALLRFLSCLAGKRIPAAFAVIPASAQQELGELMATTPHAVLTHGWSHRNHAPAGEKKAEFGGHRHGATMLEELREGRERLARLFGRQALPVFAPPWNRVDRTLASRLAEAGFTGLSTYGRRQAESSLVIEVNAHWDPVDWRKGGGLACEADLIEALARLIEEELAAPASSLEPIGLLTHHLVHDAWIERFLDEVLTRLAEAPAVRFLHPREVFRCA